jgi:hypothetical protein
VQVLAWPFIGVVLLKGAVLNKSFQTASLTSLVGLSLFYPLIESLDRWDGPGPPSDSELQVIVILTFVGIVILLAHLCSSLVVSVLSAILPALQSRTHKPIHTLVFTFYPTVTGSPPLSLRI